VPAGVGVADGAADALTLADASGDVLGAPLALPRTEALALVLLNAVKLADALGATVLVIDVHGESERRALADDESAALSLDLARAETEPGAVGDAAPDGDTAALALAAAGEADVRAVAAVDSE
jgi:hypothetical protein